MGVLGVGDLGVGGEEVLVDVLVQLLNVIDADPVEIVLVVEVVQPVAQALVLLVELLATLLHPHRFLLY